MSTLSSATHRGSPRSNVYTVLLILSALVLLLGCVAVGFQHAKLFPGTPAQGYLIPEEAK